MRDEIGEATTWLAGEVKKVQRARRRGGGGRPRARSQEVFEGGREDRISICSRWGRYFYERAGRVSSPTNQQLPPQLGSPIATAPMRKEVARQLLLGFPAVRHLRVPVPVLEDHWVYCLHKKIW
jgi:hypothetical protein